jgi:hypothetical protein
MVEIPFEAFTRAGKVMKDIGARYFGDRLEETCSCRCAKLLSGASISRSGYASRGKKPDQVIAVRVDTVAGNQQARH